MLSRVFGLARDTVFAALFGTSFVADAFNLAYLIPNFFRRVVGEGNLNPAFIPVFTEITAKRGAEEAARFLRRTFGALLVVLAVLLLFGVLLAEPLVLLYAHDWDADPQGFDFAVSLLRLLFPYLVFAGCAAFASAALNARRHFAVPALAPILISVFFLLGGAAALAFPTLEERANVFAVGGLVGGLAAWIVQLPKMRELSLPALPAWSPADADVRRVAKLMLPGFLALGVTHLNSFVDTLLALRLEEGALSALRLGNRVTLLPLGVIGVAISTASLPTLAARAAENDRKRLLDTVAHALALLDTFLVPATVGLVLLAKPIVALLFQYGEFTAERSTPMTADALTFYALGLPAYGLVKGLASAFYSVQDTKTPVKIAALSVVVNLALNLALIGPLGLKGLALATSLAAWVNALLLRYQLRHSVGELPWRHTAGPTVRTVVASGALSLACLLGIDLSERFLPGDSLLPKAARVFVPMALGLLSLLAAYRILGHQEMREILSALPGRKKDRP
jgi:putative peptidoglycan lipid II flippase